MVNGLKRPIGVAGLGLEYRTRGGKELADVGTAAALAKQYGCKGTELVSCDAVSTSFLHLRSHLFFTMINGPV